MLEISDDEDEGALPDNLRPEPILELNVRKTVFHFRNLTYVYLTSFLN